ncbi:MAG TPA: hypothetical protein VFB66_15805, partial [Tepidisphaeraceae bacterium]|nr:hypothetical protein [Tepidisphaeraceae bacterium]
MPYRPAEPLEPRRLFAAWGLDPSFNRTGVAITEVPVPTAPNPVEALVQDDGKYVVAARWDHHGVMRFNADGSVDRAFGENGGVSRRQLGVVSDIALQ